MRKLRIYSAIFLGSLLQVACTSTADVASLSATEGGSANVGGGSANVGGDSSATGGQGGTAQGGSSSGGSSAGGVSVAAIEVVRSALSPITTPDISDAEYASFISDSNAFGLELQQQLVATQGLAEQNGVFSPTSAQLALAMTYGGAVGDTAAGMKTALHDNLGGVKYHAACNRLLRDLGSRNLTNVDAAGNVRHIELTPANSLWVDRTEAVKTPFLDLLGQQYDSGMRRVDFMNEWNPSRLAINGWVMDNTHQKIHDLLLEQDIDEATRFVLVNALYFYGSWAKPFAKTETQLGTFHALTGTDVQASMMHGGGFWNYKSTSSATVVQVPYVAINPSISGNLSMTVVLPNAGQFEAARAQVSGAWLSTMTQGLTATSSVNLTMPKFKIETPQLQLKEGLKRMGMASAFESADFTGMTDDRSLYIAKVIQKAFIGVDEDGTEAAAATAVIVESIAMPGSIVPVVVDRPFLFFIQDPTGLVLFSGQVVDPTS